MKVRELLEMDLLDRAAGLYWQDRKWVRKVFGFEAYDAATTAERFFGASEDGEGPRVDEYRVKGGQFMLHKVVSRPKSMRAAKAAATRRNKGISYEDIYRYGKRSRK